nr:hypothetical protein CFP56_30641 [Quercus suber]
MNVTNDDDDDNPTTTRITSISLVIFLHQSNFVTSSACACFPQIPEIARITVGRMMIDVRGILPCGKNLACDIIWVNTRHTVHRSAAGNGREKRLPPPFLSTLSGHQGMGIRERKKEWSGQKAYGFQFAKRKLM